MANSTIERLRALYDSRMKRHVVPEWRSDSGDFVFFTKPWTVADSLAIKSLADQNSPKANLAILQRKALNDAGEPIFRIEEREELEKILDADIVARLAEEIVIFGAAEPIEDTEKN